MIVDGKECLNLATFNFLGFIENKQVQVRQVAELNKYMSSVYLVWSVKCDMSEECGVTRVD